MNEQLRNSSRQGLFGNVTKDLLTAEAGISSWTITLEARLIHGEQKLTVIYSFIQSLDYCDFKAKYFSLVVWFLSNLHK